MKKIENKNCCTYCDVLVGDCSGQEHMPVYNKNSEVIGFCLEAKYIRGHNRTYLKLILWGQGSSDFVGGGIFL